MFRKDEEFLNLSSFTESELSELSEFNVLPDISDKTPEHIDSVKNLYANWTKFDSEKFLKNAHFIFYRLCKAQGEIEKQKEELNRKAEELKNKEAELNQKEQQLLQIENNRKRKEPEQTKPKKNFGRQLRSYHLWQEKNAEAYSILKNNEGRSPRNDKV